jgi:heme A synthase
VDTNTVTRPDKSTRWESRWLPRFAISSAIAVYFLIIFGSQVRVSDSGMGCPDWPLCEGSVGPIYQYHALMEQTHRYIAAVVTILVVITALLARRVRAPRTVNRPALFTVGVVVVQIALGAITVFAGNGAPTVAAHLLAGLALLGGATITAVATLVPLSETSGSRHSRVGWIANIFAGLLFISGSLVVNAEAEKACASIPFCPSGQPTRFVVLHLIHRGVAILAAIALFAFAYHAWQQWSARRGARTLAATLTALIIATAGLGIFSALLKAPPGLQDFHLAGAAAVLAAAVALATLGWLTASDSSDELRDLTTVTDQRP